MAHKIRRILAATQHAERSNHCFPMTSTTRQHDRIAALYFGWRPSFSQADGYHAMDQRRRHRVADALLTVLLRS
jgi:hypothetical protein